VIASVACVIPALDAAATLAGVAGGLRDSVPHAKLIAVDDGSIDNTREVARRMCDVVIGFDRNRGKGAALRAGLAEALALGVSAVLTIDADGQHDARMAPALLEALTAADVAIGARARRGTNMPLGRRLTNMLASAAIGAIAGVSVPDAQSGYRAIRRAVLDRVKPRGDRYEYETDFLIRAALAGFRVSTVPVPTLYGAAASSFRGASDSMRVVRAIWRHRARAFR
jgi:glycosyltransferase involved in cell wall biosynthesis